jgi:endonuclease G, mitochondrial
MAQFGKFPSLSAFLESYKTAEKKRLVKEISAAAPAIAERAKRIKKVQKQQRNVVEVNALLTSHEPDDDDAAGGLHARLLVAVQTILKNDPDVAKDVKEARASGRNVFVAIRIGDSQGIVEPIKGLKEGAALHLQGEWITKEKAHAHGGERMSVLHFTHHPLGFTCTPVKCYM